MLSNSSNEGKRSSKRNVDSFGDTRKYNVSNTYGVIVGISNYQHSKWNLKYADRDAEEIYQLLLTPSGGGFEERNVKKLINEQATTLGITKALRTFLKRPDKEDLVLLFFACHATPDEIRPANIYLLTHDTDPNDISGTALPMREIDLSLRENLLAERIVIIADTCHSASIGGSIIRRSAIDDARVINAYLQKVSEAKGGVALLTSAEASETSQEDQKWGGGHGVLTYFLLKGMKGEADGYGGQPKDGTVTVGELFDYVRDNVKEATDNQQHPSIGTNIFDRNLTISITGGINAQEHYQIASRLYDLGWLLDDIELFRSSAQEFSEAVRLAQSAKTPLLAAELGFAQAKLAYGAYEKTLHDLSKLSTEEEDKEVQSEALFLKGIAQSKIYDIHAPETFEIFHAQFPEHHNTLWAKDYASWLRNHAKGRRYALLIGINRYVTSVVSPLAGCVNDVSMVKKVLTQHCNFDETDVFTLVDQAATRNGIFDAFEELTRKTTIADTVIIHYSGHSIGERSKDNAPEFSSTYLIAHDTEFDSKLGICINGITSEDLHGLVSMIPAERKTLILDTHPRMSFIELVKKDGKYALLLASDSAEIAYERQIKVDGEYATAGAFTSTLVDQFKKFDSSALTHGKLIDAVIQDISTLGFDTPQTPILIGNRYTPIFEPEDIYLNFYDFSNLSNFASHHLEILNELYTKYRSVGIIFAKGYYSFGRAFLEKNKYSLSIDALQTAIQQQNGNYPEAILALGKAQVLLGGYTEALKTFQEYIIAARESTAVVQSLIEKIGMLSKMTKHALLVGIDDYLSDSITPSHGAVNDVLALKQILITKFGFVEENITTLLNHTATYSAILESFKLLVEQACNEPALFYFSGNGSRNKHGFPVIISVDGREGQVYDIDVQELIELAKVGAHNLVSILDAGFQWTEHNSRYTKRDTRLRPARRNISPTSTFDSAKIEPLRIGHISIYPYSVTSVRPEDILAKPENNPSESNLELPSLETKSKYHGSLAYPLIRGLDGCKESTITYAQWFDSASKYSKDPFIVLGEHEGEQWVSGYPILEYLQKPPFENSILREEVVELITKLEHTSIYETIGLLRIMIEERQQQNDLYPEGHLNLGLAYSVIGDYDNSVDHLERAISLYSDQSVMSREKGKDLNSEDHYHEARYHLGRVLFESKKDFTRAVSELNEAIKLNPENGNSYYYLGKAILSMIEYETLAKSKNAFKKYLAKGAPLGHEEEVRKEMGTSIKSPG